MRSNGSLCLLIIYFVPVSDGLTIDELSVDNSGFRICTVNRTTCLAFGNHMDGNINYAFLTDDGTQHLKFDTIYDPADGYKNIYYKSVIANNNMFLKTVP